MGLTRERWELTRERQLHGDRDKMADLNEGPDQALLRGSCIYLAKCVYISNETVFSGSSQVRYFIEPDA
jgi:hypothetical protein